jgi:hypothetical protein
MEDLTCWICGMDLAAHTHAERIECEKQPLGDSVLVVHGNALDLELRIVRRVLDVLGQLQPSDK